jgi:hypothetical protein
MPTIPRCRPPGSTCLERQRHPASNAMPGSEEELDRGLTVINCQGPPPGMTVASCPVTGREPCHIAALVVQLGKLCPPDVPRSAISPL